MVLGRGAREIQHPRLRLRRDHRLLETVIAIVQPGLRPRRQRLVDAFVDGGAAYSQVALNHRGALTQSLPEQNSCPLRFPFERLA